MQLDEISDIAVIGLGRMGHGIAQSFAMAGYRVRGFDSNAAARDTTCDRIRRNLRDFAANGLIEETAVETTLDRIHIACSETEAAAGAQFVVEAIAEKLEAKRQLFARIEKSVDERAIIASNSSTFTVSESGAQMHNRARAIVTHWFNPPHIVPTVEVVPSGETSEQVVETTVELHRKIGKLAVRVNNELPGFLVNRVQIAMIREVWDLYERGVASASDIDAAIRGSIGFRLAICGPLGICDFGGLDIWSTVYQGLAPELRHDSRVPDSIQNLVEQGHLGPDSGRGIHNYENSQADRMMSERDEAMLKLAGLFHQPSGGRDELSVKAD